RRLRIAIGDPDPCPRASERDCSGAPHSDGASRRLAASDDEGGAPVQPAQLHAIPPPVLHHVRRASVDVVTGSAPQSPSAPNSTAACAPGSAATSTARALLRIPSSSSVGCAVPTALCVDPARCTVTSPGGLPGPSGSR